MGDNNRKNEMLDINLSTIKTNSIITNLSKLIKNIRCI
ncbi:hypothetical protein IM45_684 [Candidatus Palibaumannia cicadellinicola]|uniref:Uncharacterized protein n=1 Tax=Candidatus Palibaumannia cicadellinicola TaxID=186490 RepID=A0A088N1K6_9GAMM|nr:hypothetical protein IM45_684 [Candidatus Baumannia cicadellinicola]